LQQAERRTAVEASRRDVACAEVFSIGSDSARRELGRREVKESSRERTNRREAKETRAKVRAKTKERERAKVSL